MQPNVESLIEAARRLPPEDREKLANALQTPYQVPRHRITEIRGVGKELWETVDAQDYINAERDAWDN